MIERRIDQTKLDTAFELEDLPKSYYWRDGWSFNRLDGGLVELTKRRSATPSSPVELRVVVPATEWAEIVCSVSANGLSLDRWKRAVEFHGK